MANLFAILFAISFTLLLLLALVVYRPPAILIRRLQRRWPDVLFYVSTGSKLVALTIDDGPSTYTREIQHILSTHGAKATFFLIGSHMPGHDAILRDAIRDGHELANHALHDEPSVSLSPAELTSQIKTVERQISSIYADSDAAAAATAAAAGNPPSPRTPPRFFRPGSGFFNTSMRKMLRDLDYRLVLGNVYPHDAQISLPSLNAAHVLGAVNPGAIIVCHDRKWTPPMLRAILPVLNARGFRVVTVSRLLDEVRR